MMKNPFKFGTIVEEEFFTDRHQELQRIVHMMNSENHLVLISPRRFGKSSLVVKAIKQLDRPYVMLNLQQVINTEDFAVKILKQVFKLFRWEKLKHLMSHFRVVPTVSVNPITEGVEVAFQPMADTRVLLEDAMGLLERVSTPEKRLIVVLDEFQEIKSIDKTLDKQLRAIMQLQHNLNFIFLGSQESMMEDIFERKKSPFYHFGLLMRLDRIPYDDFYAYVAERLGMTSSPDGYENVTRQILEFTQCHPYYTQQLASQVWELMNYEQMEEESIVHTAVVDIVRSHDLDFERLWIGFNRMDKRIMQSLCIGQNPLQNRQVAPSTTFSALKRLMKAGYVIRTNDYSIEDPFFRTWIAEQLA